MLSNQTLVDALNSLVVLAADRKKVGSSELQSRLLGTAAEIATELAERGGEISQITLRDAESKTATWEAPFVAQDWGLDDVKFIIAVPEMVKLSSR